jgi:hypothetical protein
LKAHIIPEKCHPCLRTPVPDVSGLYSFERSVQMGKGARRLGMCRGFCAGEHRACRATRGWYGEKRFLASIEIPRADAERIENHKENDQHP